MDIDWGVGATPERLMCESQIHEQVDRPLNVRKASHQLDVTTPLTRMWATFVVLTLVGARKSSTR